MIAKPFAAFGFIVYLCTTEKDETKSVMVNEDGVYNSGYYYTTKGVARPVVVETNEKLKDRNPGWLNSENTNLGSSTSGSLLVTFMEDSEWLCIPKHKNITGLPKLSSIVCEKGEMINLVKGTNLFVVNGSLTINGKNFNGPTQIHVRTGDVISKAMIKTYALKFE